MAASSLVEDYHGRTRTDRHFADPILFWDETLRDGEQTPGVHFSPEEKLRVAERLSDLGVSIINAGIPVVSEEEAEAVRRVAGAGLKAGILAAARTVPGDIEAVIRSGVRYIAIFVAASQVHLRYKLKMTEDQVLDASVASVRRAKEAGLHVAFVTEDTVRAPFDFVERLYKAVQAEKADRLVISDTVGIMTPLTFRWYLEEFRRRVQPLDWSVHCHNDLGLAVANTLTALEVGVTCPHVCVNGLGERAGNASLEEVAVALESLYGVKTGLKTSQLYELSRLVEELSGIPLAANKAIVGYNSFSHEAGIHTHGILAHTLTYEPLQPEVVGRKRRMILGKHTGRAALAEKLKEHRLVVPDAVLSDLQLRIKLGTEAQSKEEMVRFLTEYRARFEQPGIPDEEFWRLAKRAGVPEAPA
ncbi:MAG: homoaconitate hydratase [Thermoplasmata archaeon]|nr:homoaconitate hydratase [Thermoplasmata archaeon]MCI4359032.1 homoaconitate hydratase [Thermoplasmata archaeon]